MRIRHRPAFTLLEVLVSIAIIAVLLALVVPTIGKSREHASAVKSTVNLRALCAAIFSYCSASHERFPRIDEGVSYPIGPETDRFTFPSAQVVTMWPGVVYRELPVDANRSIFLSPGFSRARAAAFPLTSYRYSAAFAARPEALSGVVPSLPQSALARASTLAEVLFPSSKAILWDAELLYRRSPVRMASDEIAEPLPLCLADGACVQRAPADAKPATSNALWPVYDDAKLHSTLHGVRGVDF